MKKKLITKTYKIDKIFSQQKTKTFYLKQNKFNFLFWKSKTEQIIDLIKQFARCLQNLSLDRTFYSVIKI